MLFFLLLIGLLIAIAITFAFLQIDGVNWMNETGQSLLEQQEDTIVSLSTSQARFAEVLLL
jgi:hypothetical protein